VDGLGDSSNSRLGEGYSRGLGDSSINGLVDDFISKLGDDSTNTLGGRWLVGNFTSGLGNNSKFA